MGAHFYITPIILPNTHWHAERTHSRGSGSDRIMQDRIVEGQLKRLEEEYDMVHQFNVLPTENPLSNPEISEMLKKEFP